MKRNVGVGVTFLVVVAGLGVGSAWLEKRAALEAAAVQAPRFEIDPFWPKPLPNNWILGRTIGVSVDARDHVWIIHRAGSLEGGRTRAARGRTEPAAGREPDRRDAVVQRQHGPEVHVGRGH